MPTSLSSTTSSAKSCCRPGSVMALPPYLMTMVLPWNFLMYGSAWARISALSRGATCERSCVASGAAAGVAVMASSPRRAKGSGAESYTLRPLERCHPRWKNLTARRPSSANTMSWCSALPGRDHRRGLGGPAWRAHAARRAPRISGRHGHRCWDHQLLRPAHQRAWRDPPDRAAGRRCRARRLTALFLDPLSACFRCPARERSRWCNDLRSHATKRKVFTRDDDDDDFLHLEAATLFLRSPGDDGAGMGRRCSPGARRLAWDERPRRRSRGEDSCAGHRRYGQRRQSADCGLRRRLLLGRARRVPARPRRRPGGLRLRRRQEGNGALRDGRHRPHRPRRIGEDHLRPEEGGLRNAAADLLLGG